MKVVMIDLSCYELAAHVPLNCAAVHTCRAGALLKVLFEDGLIGYADCHPWVELGDAGLPEQLRLLNEGMLTPLTQRSLHFASLDAKARSEGVSLFSGLTTPRSHLLIPNLEQCDLSMIEGAVQCGFGCFKIKLGKHLTAELTKLKELLDMFPSMACRLDFNLKLSSDQFAYVLQEIAPWKEQIEFYEDPFVFETRAWEALQKRGYSLACDHQSQHTFGFSSAAAVLVLKPAIQDHSGFLTNLTQKLVVTSYLDHPLGQMTAAYVAALAQRAAPERVGTCGLLSHTVYQTNEFSAQLECHGPELIPPEGTGFGFDVLLAKQQWKLLSKAT